MSRAPSKDPEIPRVAFYARCSDIKQAEKELSIPAQILACEKEARRRGWEPTARYIEAAESAKSADRPVFQQMIADARKKKKDFDYILVWKFSRFGVRPPREPLRQRALQEHAAAQRREAGVAERAGGRLTDGADARGNPGERGRVLQSEPG